MQNSPISRTASHPYLRTLRTLLATSLLGAACATALAATAPASLAAGAPRVEARITEMHTRLQIDTAQEPQWKIVAQTMRDNQLALEPLVAEREKNAPTATALQDLDSFAAVSEAHAAGIRKFITAFEPLYAAMSTAQKKDADTLFRSGAGKMGKSK